MGRSQESYSKREKEKKRLKRKKEKQERREQRKLEKEERGKKTFQEMLSYVDSDGNLTTTPPDPSEKVEIKAEDIVLGVPPKEHEPVQIIRYGRVKYFDHDKGYGFILDRDSQESIFVHATQCSSPISESDKVTFKIEKGPKGPTATEVSIVE